MSNFKRRKKRQRKSGWASDGRLYKYKWVDGRLSRNVHKRKKNKEIVILAKSKPGKMRWFMMEGNEWFVWSRYERLRDAKNAITGFRKKPYPSEYYDFKIGE